MSWFVVVFYQYGYQGDWMIGLEHLTYGAHLAGYDTRNNTVMRLCVLWELIARHLGWTIMAKNKANQW
jgi:hypothetical protein